MKLTLFSCGMLKFQLLPGVCCTTSRVAVVNYRGPLLKVASVLGMWAFVSACLAPFGYLPFFHVNSSWNIPFSHSVSVEEIRVFQACACVNK